MNETTALLGAEWAMLQLKNHPLLAKRGEGRGEEPDMPDSLSQTKLGLNMNDTLTLFRPVGPKEFALIQASGYRAFPPRLPGQPIFYPVLNMNYAVQIARDWNVRDSGAGYVTRFHVRKEFILKYPVQTVGDNIHQELWIPAEELPELNNNIVGEIEVIAVF